MSNTELIASIVAAESLAVLSNELVFTNKLDRTYEGDFDLEVEDHRIGPTINIPLPIRTSVRSGWALQTQNATETSVPLTINLIRGADIAFTDAEMALVIQDPNKNLAAFSKRFVKPRITRLANEIDSINLSTAYVTIANQVGTAGTVPQTWEVIGDAMQKLDDNLADQSGRVILMNPAMRNKMAAGVKGVFQEEVATQALIRGLVKKLGDMEFYMTQLIPTQTVGAQGGTPLSNGATPQTGSNIITNGWTNNAAVLNAGDIITFAGVYDVNYVTGTASSSLKQFVVTANVVADGSGNATIPISTGIGGYTGIVTSGPTKNCSAGVADDSAVTVTGSASTGYAQNIAFTPDAFTVAFAKLTNPKRQGVDSATATYDGFSMRYMRGYDIVNAQQLDRLDAYWGIAGKYTQHAVRITA